MRLSLLGHDYKYAAEQIMLSLFPQERPLYVPEAGPEALSAQIRLSHGQRFSTATTDLYYEGKRYRGRARCLSPSQKDTLGWDREMQKIIKLSFFRAACDATGQAPHWGALTGIRPGKIATGLLEAGKTPREIKKIFRSHYYVHPHRAELCIHTARAGLAAKARFAPEDICLYVGIPFCPSRCAYCSFVSNSVERSARLVEPYLQALHREIAATAQVVRDLGLQVRALYIGGGTPSSLTAEQLRVLTAALARHFNLSRLAEYTVEAGRPDTLDEKKLHTLRAAAVNRISINPQSMEEHVLKAIGRGHNAAAVTQAFALARQAGFPLINMDLIAGLPSDSPAGFSRSLERVLAFDPAHITVHSLSLKKGSKIMLEQTSLPTAAAVEEMLDTAISKLSGAGYMPYYLYRQKFTAGGFENVGWCKPGSQSLYNIAIMEEFCSILALGGGGSTKLVAPRAGRIQRIFNAKYPYEYTEKIDKILKSKEKIKEFYEREVF